MATVQELTHRLEALRQAMATGASEVRYTDGRSTTFRSVSEMRRLADDLEAQIAAAGGASPVRVIQISGHKGL